MNIASVEKLNSKRSFLFFALLGWFVINILQAFFTELAHDEAYYWMYSRQLDWGYFDHPPMVALFIKAGYQLFSNELGVRLLFVLLGTGSVYNIYRLTEPENPALFFAITFSIILVHGHFAGFLALPDMPLIFFSTCFLRLFKAYQQTDHWGVVLLLAVTIACMFYSKYHALLIVFFMVVANLQLFRRKSFYIIIVLVAAALIPHLLWQIEHNFPSFTYHLVSRSSPAYSVTQTLEYLLTQPLIAGPLTGVVLLFHSFVYKPANPFNRSLKVMLAGFYLFFLLMTFKGRVEAHWLAAAIIPLIILSYHKIKDSLKLRKTIYSLSLTTLVLFIIFRVLLVVNWIPDHLNYRSELHKWKLWAQEIDSVANGKPVVFIDKFQFPSKYTFYTGNFATTLNSIMYRNNQYDIWNYEDSIQGKTVMLNRSGDPSGILNTSIGKEIKYSIVPNFRSFFNAVSINAETLLKKTAPGDSIPVQVHIINKTDKELIFNEPETDSTFLSYTVFQRGKVVQHTRTLRELDLDPLPPRDTVRYPIVLQPFHEAGKYDIVFSMLTDKLPPASNNSLLQIAVEK